jgi:protein-S-isoprenylcysteine O-methyltransferase Ste14
MRILRIGVMWLMALGVSGSAVAGDLKKSIARAAEQQSAQVEAPPAPTKGYALVGGALVIGGVVAVAYGFLHTKSFEEWQPAHIAVGSVGLGAVIAGGLVLLNGQDQATRSPSVAFGPHGVKVSKHLSW